MGGSVAGRDVIEAEVLSISDAAKNDWVPGAYPGGEFICSFLAYFVLEGLVKDKVISAKGFRHFCCTGPSFSGGLGGFDSGHP
jgi:hypothetical protein